MRELTEPPPGTLFATKTHHNDPAAVYTIRLTGQEAYDLQNVLRETTLRTESFDEASLCVFLADIMRRQIAHQKETP
jgi:hypothetical protein